jgi:transcription elongation factor GreA
MIVARISHIEGSLNRAEVIDPNKIQSDKVQFGAKLKLSNVDTGDEISYQIVGPEEANLDQGRISVASPLARALLGHFVGDEVKVRLPNGQRSYEILDIRYG